MSKGTKAKTVYRCVECGCLSPKWQGKCPDCGAWDTLVKETAQSSSAPPTGNEDVFRFAGEIPEFVSLEGASVSPDRFSSGVDELDRALGGGLVRGSAVLLGGQPGIGKSTLLSQTLGRVASLKEPAVYVSGEESADQVRLRFRRLDLPCGHIKFLPMAELEPVLAAVDALKNVRLLVIDSIQTMYTSYVPSPPGTVAQVRAAANALVRFCKLRDITLIIIGHVTKDGQIAGPKLLEHMVDVVLYFEGEEGGNLRVVRAVKNRFGPAGEAAFFDMRKEGLQEVRNPSSFFLTGRDPKVPGSALCAGMQGTRPVLAEVQALVAQSHMATPRRAVVGWDSNRLAMLLAVLQVRCGVFLADKEIYLNVTGGLKMAEPAADLAAAAAVLSAVYNRPLPADCALFGETGLSGEVRPAGFADTRIREACDMGFGFIVCPRLTEDKREAASKIAGAKVTEIRSARDLLALFKE